MFQEYKQHGAETGRISPEMSSAHIDYEEDGFPILIANGLTCCLYKSQAFRCVKDSITTESEQDIWRSEHLYEGNMKECFILSQLIRAFAIDLDTLALLLEEKVNLLNEFINKSYSYNGISCTVNLTDVDFEDKLKWIEITSVLKIFKNRRYYNKRALMYILKPKLYEDYEYLPGYKDRIDECVNTLGIDTLADNNFLEAVLRIIPPEFETPNGLVDAGGLVYLLESFVKSKAGTSGEPVFIPSGNGKTLNESRLVEYIKRTAPSSRWNSAIGETDLEKALYLADN